MANYRAARALLGKGRNAGKGGRPGFQKRERKKSTEKRAVNRAKPKK